MWQNYMHFVVIPQIVDPIAMWLLGLVSVHYKTPAVNESSSHFAGGCANGSKICEACTLVPWASLNGLETLRITILAGLLFC